MCTMRSHYPPIALNDKGKRMTYADANRNGNRD